MKKVIGYIKSLKRPTEGILIYSGLFMFSVVFWWFIFEMVGRLV